MIKNESAINANLENSWARRGWLNRIYYAGVFSFAHRYAGFPAGASESKILDLGAGDGHVAMSLFEGGAVNVTAFDYNPTLGRRAHPFRTVVGRIPDDMHTLEGGAPFDHVLILGVLHHLESGRLGEVFTALDALTHDGSRVVIWEPYNTFTLRLMYLIIGMRLLRFIPWVARAHGCLTAEKDIIADFIGTFFEDGGARRVVRNDLVRPFYVLKIASYLHGVNIVLGKDRKAKA